MYKYHTDEIYRGGNISKDNILQYVSPYDIYQFAVGYRPELDRMYTSPFRKDEEPNCYYTEYNNRLILIDFAARGRFIKKVNLSHVDSFNAVMLLHNLKSIYEAINLIYSKLCVDKVKMKNCVKTFSIKKPDIVIDIIPKSFEKRDREYWKQYYISKQNLIKDKVLAVKAYQIVKDKVYSGLPQDLAFCFTDFENGHKKIYFPERSKVRFLTNCRAEDIGGIKSLPPTAEKLVITKSYKDWRVLRNQDYNVIWLQSETVTPESLERVCKRFDEIIILFDNDDAGIQASKLLWEKITSFALDIKVRELCVPKIKGVTDPSDFIKHNIIEFKRFIKNFL